MDFSQARDEICSLFYTAWQADTAAIAGYVPEVRWSHVTVRDPPPTTAVWARVTVTMGATSEAIGPSPKMYTRMGVVAVQIFADRLDQGLTVAEQLAKVARAAFEGKSTAGGAWFRNVQLADNGVDAPWVSLTVTAELEYEEIT